MWVYLFFTGLSFVVWSFVAFHWQIVHVFQHLYLFLGFVPMGLLILYCNLFIGQLRFITHLFIINMWLVCYYYYFASTHLLHTRTCLPVVYFVLTNMILINLNISCERKMFFWARGTRKAFFVLSALVFTLTVHSDSAVLNIRFPGQFWRKLTS